MGLIEWTSLLGNVGEFVGAIAVVLTLMYLAVQVRYSKAAVDANTAAVEMSREVASAQAEREFMLAWTAAIQSVWVDETTSDIMMRGFQQIQGLSNPERGVFHGRIASLVVLHSSLCQMFQRGLIPKQMMRTADSADCAQQSVSRSRFRDGCRSGQHINVERPALPPRRRTHRFFNQTQCPQPLRTG